LRRDQGAANANSSAGCHSLHRSVIRERVFRDDLKIPQARAVVHLDKRKIFRIAPRPHPALDLNRVDRRGALQCVFDWSWRKSRHLRSLQLSTLNAQLSTLMGCQIISSKQAAELGWRAFRTVDRHAADRALDQL